MLALGQCCSTRPRIHSAPFAADVGELGAPLLAELREEALDHFLAPALDGPVQPTRDVIDDQCQVALASTQTDLIDAGALQVIQSVVTPRGALGSAPTPAEARY